MQSHRKPGPLSVVHVHPSRRETQLGRSPDMSTREGGRTVLRRWWYFRHGDREWRGLSESLVEGSTCFEGGSLVGSGIKPPIVLMTPSETLLIGKFQTPRGMPKDEPLCMLGTNTRRFRPSLSRSFHCTSPHRVFIDKSTCPPYIRNMHEALHL